MASIDRTAYPRFKKSVPSQELYDVFTPSSKEIEWAQRATRSDEHLLALVVLLKGFQRLGYSPRMDEVPHVVVDHVRSRLDLATDVECSHDSDRTRRHHQALVRARQGVNSDREAARILVEETMRTEARIKDNPADLINVALEELTRSSFELPGFTVLDKMAARVRAEVNHGFFFGIIKRMGATTSPGWKDCCKSQQGGVPPRPTTSSSPRAARRCRGSSSTCAIWTCSGRPRCGWRRSPRPRSSIGCWISPSCASSTMTSASRWWPAWSTWPGCGLAMRWRACSAVGWRRSTRRGASASRVEVFHGFSSWLRFGNNGTLADNDPDHMELLVKWT